MKFGGTSVASVERIKRVAQIIKKEVDNGYMVAVVVSAMAKETQRLLDLCSNLCESQIDNSHEYATVVSTGEQVVVGCLVLALRAEGIDARSWLAWQLPIITEEVCCVQPRISAIDVKGLNEGFDKGIHSVVAGYQCITREGRVLTLGRGGSDTSAAALAAALEAERCDIYTDVDGIYTTDPNITSKARKLSKISYEEMLELSSLGSKVLHVRSVELAMKYGVSLRVISSFEDKPGTMVCKEEEIVESKAITGITCSHDEAQVTLLGVPDAPGIAAALFDCLAEANINIDMIFQDVNKKGKTSITFTTSRSYLDKTHNVISASKDLVQYESFTVDNDVAKISVVGIGMRSHVGVARQVFHVLAKEHVNILAIATSEIRISILVKEKYMELAVRALHDSFALEQ